MNIEKFQKLWDGVEALHSPDSKEITEVRDLEISSSDIEELNPDVVDRNLERVLDQIWT